jgi:hypothetical protein
LKTLFILLLSLRFCAAFATCSTENLFRDLLIVDYWNQRLNERLPVTFNHLLQGGYFNMPSARMGNEGELGFGYASVPPYRNYNFRCQLIDRLEVSGNYRIFKGVDDPVLTKFGYGDFAEKGANLKLALLHPEDSGYRLPGIAIGLEDFIGTKGFHSQYIVLTQVFPKYNLEMSLGCGSQRIKGVFGGLLWMPFRNSEQRYLKNIALAMEYDATPYKDFRYEKHPKGRKVKSPINVGLKYRLWDFIDLSVSCVRGNAVAFSASTFYNLGTTKGILPKIHDALPYKAPINTEPLGPRRPEEVLVQDLLYAMRTQGLDLLKATLSIDPCGSTQLRLSIINNKYRLEQDFRNRLNHLLAYLIPSNIDSVIAVVEADGLPTQEYRYQMDYVRNYASKIISSYELEVLTPMREATKSDKCTVWQQPKTLFETHRDLWNIELLPRNYNFFGSSRGKFKYAIGLALDLNGFLFNNLYYSIRLGYTLFNNLDHLTGIDRLNPSRLPNVRTDIVRYYEAKGVTVDEAYLQRSWNLGKGWYSRLSGGYFEVEYGGLAAEFLHYPVNSQWAFGCEGAFLKKRKYSGLGFTNKIRQLHGMTPYYHKFTPYQIFANTYYEWKRAHIDWKISAGKFLANDWGARFEAARYFASGLKITIWYTLTNGHDKINGSIYHDKGISISMPLDILYTYSERSKWYYELSAWLRDVGASAYTGQTLYDTIREQRLNY